MMRMREQEARKSVTQNPVKMAQIKREVAELRGKSAEARKEGGEEGFQARKEGSYPRGGSPKSVGRARVRRRREGQRVERWQRPESFFVFVIPFPFPLPVTLPVASAYGRGRGRAPSRTRPKTQSEPEPRSTGDERGQGRGRARRCERAGWRQGVRFDVRQSPAPKTRQLFVANDATNGANPPEKSARLLRRRSDGRKSRLGRAREGRTGLGTAPGSSARRRRRRVWRR